MKTEKEYLLEFNNNINEKSKSFALTKLIIGLVTELKLKIADINFDQNQKNVNNKISKIVIETNEKCNVITRQIDIKGFNIHDDSLKRFMLNKTPNLYSKVKWD